MKVRFHNGLLLCIITGDADNIRQSTLASVSMKN
jgi:hypothetical protein